jgi:LacI family transcriptional regulator
VIAAKIPMVFVDRLPFNHGCDFVGIDNRLATREAIEYLLSIGHRRIAFVAPDENVTTIEDRLNGYIDSFMAAGMTPPQDLIFRLSLAKSLTREGLLSEIERVIGEFAAMPDRPTAIFAINDFLAQYLLMALSEKGFAVPGDIGVMGFDDVEQFLPQKSKLTTVRQPFEAMGERAASMILWRMSHSDENGPFQHILLPTRLIVGETVRPVG